MAKAIVVGFPVLKDDEGQGFVSILIVLCHSPVWWTAFPVLTPMVASLDTS